MAERAALAIVLLALLAGCAAPDESVARECPDDASEGRSTLYVCPGTNQTAPGEPRDNTRGLGG